jgi:signal transduction histidine kinase
LLPIMLAFFVDSILNGVLFGGCSHWQQLVAPTNHQITIGILFSIFILAAVIVGAQLLWKVAGLESRLPQRSEDLLIATQELEEFSYTLSHDLRNMLTKRYASVDLLREQCQHISDKRVKFLIENISTSSDTMERQIETLLNLAMIPSGAFNRLEEHLDRIAHDITDTLVGGRQTTESRSRYSQT